MGNGRIIKRENKYTQISNDAIRDECLSLKAIGLYSKINSYLTIPDWDLYKVFLMRKCKEGEDAFDTAWNELKTMGYLVQHKIRDENGKYCYEYELLDELTTPRKSTSGKSTSGKSTCGKPPSISNTGFSNTDFSNTDINNNNVSQIRKKSTKSKDVVVDAHIKMLVDGFKEKYNADLDPKRANEIIDLKGISHATECLDTYGTYIKGKKIDSLGGYFFKFATEGYTKPVGQVGILPQHQNFKQREFVEDEFEKIYANQVR